MHSMSKVANHSGLRLIAVASLLMGLAACGGGGGSSGGGALPTGSVTITSANQSAVAGAAVDSAVGGTSLPIAAQTSTAAAPAADSVAQKIGQVAYAAAQQITAQGSTPVLVTGAVTSYPCTISGTYSINSGTATYNNCSNIAGETVNGTITLSNIASAADTTFDSTYSLTITLPGDVITAAGDMHVVISGCTTTCTLTLTGSSLQFTSTISGITVALQNYTMDFPNGILGTLTFTFASTQIGGTAIFNMVTPFVTNGSGQFPVSGVATVTGANSTVLRLTALGNETAPANSQAQIELSTNGGATYGAPTLVTWASISSRI